MSVLDSCCIWGSQDQLAERYAPFANIKFISNDNSYLILEYRNET